jgi:hypothetical protein
MKFNDRKWPHREQLVGPVNVRGEKLEAEGRRKGLEGVELHAFVKESLTAEGLYPFPDPPEPTSWARRWRTALVTSFRAGRHKRSS